MSKEMKSSAQQAAEQTREGGLLDQIVEQGRVARDPAGKEW